MTDNIEALRLKAGKLMSQIRAIETASEVEAATAKVGKCYRYNNSYSGSDRWWLYRRVTEITKDGWLKVFDFQHCSDGRVEIRFDSLHIGSSELGEPITLKQFQHAWKILARMLNSRARDAKAVTP